jgi:hypothetical protein
VRLRMEPLVPVPGAHRAQRGGGAGQVRGVSGEERLAACGVGWGVPGRVALESEAMRETWGVHRYAASAVRDVAGGLRPVCPATARCARAGRRGVRGRP